MFSADNCISIQMFKKSAVAIRLLGLGLSPRPLPVRPLSTMPLSEEQLARLKAPLPIPERLLLGPGPTNLPPSVHEVLAKTCTLGHLHKEFVNAMDDVKLGLQYVFKTNNRLTLCVSGSGHSGMEMAFVNLIERGTTVLVCQNGIWGQRATHLAKVMNADVHTLNTPLGTAFTLDHVAEAVHKLNPKLLFVCYGESSTGVLQPLDGLGDVCRSAGCLLVVDTVAALAAAPFDMDGWKVDVMYSATQKALSAPTGLSPISFNERAFEHYKARKTAVPSFYFDLAAVGNYWGCFDEPRKYHHTMPIQLIYGLREALSLVVKEGIDECVSRHRQTTRSLYAELDRIGLNCFVADVNIRNPAVTTVRIPDNVRPYWQAIIAHVADKHGIEIAGGLGETVGVIWRVGLMGQNSRAESVQRVIAALEDALQTHGKL